VDLEARREVRNVSTEKSATNLQVTPFKVEGVAGGDSKTDHNITRSIRGVTGMVKTSACFLTLRNLTRHAKKESVRKRGRLYNQQSRGKRRNHEYWRAFNALGKDPNQIRIVMKSIKWTAREGNREKHAGKTSFIQIRGNGG